MDTPPSLLSSSNLPNNGFGKSTGSLNASDLEVDTTQSGLQHVSHEADRWKFLQTHSNLEHTPAERLAGSTSQVRYGDEQMETTERNDDPKEKSGNYPSRGTPIRRKKRFWIYTVCIAMTVAIIVVVPTTATQVLTHRQVSSHSPDPKSTAVIDGPSGSASGALNGSAISTIDAGTLDGSYHVFYQHFDGQVKHLTSPNPEEGNWGSHNIISNAQSRTPLANAVTSDGSVSTIHLFYLDKNMILQEKLYSNTSQKWQDGSLGGYKIPISNSSMFALDANSFSFAQHGHVSNIEVFYTSNDSSMHQLQWTFGNGLWNDSYTIGEANGIYRVAVEQITTGHTNELWTVNRLQEIEHWVDVDAPDYLAGYGQLWSQLGKASNVSVHESTHLRHHNGETYFQDSHGYIATLSPNFGEAAPFTKRLALPAPAEPGTDIAFFPSKQIIYFQSNDHQISAFTWDHNGTYTPIPNPI